MALYLRSLKGKKRQKLKISRRKRFIFYNLLLCFNVYRMQLSIVWMYLEQQGARTFKYDSRL